MKADKSKRNSSSGETKIYRISSSEDMEALGEKTAEATVGGEVILLSGELGAGKTVFCKGVAKGLNVKSTVVSPTFTIMNEYEGGRIKFCHFDAYRLESADEAFEAGITDFIGAENVLCAVEWWENVKDLFDGISVIRVDISKVDGGREVKITK